MWNLNELENMKNWIDFFFLLQCMFEEKLIRYRKQGLKKKETWQRQKKYFIPLWSEPFTFLPWISPSHFETCWTFHPGNKHVCRFLTRQAYFTLRPVLAVFHVRLVNVWERRTQKCSTKHFSHFIIRVLSSLCACEIQWHYFIIDWAFDIGSCIK